jgi:hypothetical protein
MKQEVLMVLEELNTLNDKLNYDVNLCTIDAKLKFKQLNTRQFNRILSTLVDNSTLENDIFDSCMCDILSENILDANQSIKDLNLLDYFKAVLETRRQCVSDTLNVIFNSEEIEENNLEEGYCSVSLSEHLNKELPELQLSQTVSEKGIQVILKIPTINKIIKLEKALKSATTGSSTDFIKKLFIKELVKYIDIIIVNDKQVNFETTEVNDFIEFINNIPAFVINETIKKIEQMKLPITNLSTVIVSGRDSSGNIITFSKELLFNGNLFNF